MTFKEILNMDKVITTVSPGIIKKKSETLKTMKHEHQKHLTATIYGVLEAN